MQSVRLERVKAEHPEIAALFDKLNSYINDQMSNGEEFIVPKLAGAALHLTDGEAYVLLRMMADAGIVRQVYNVYCREQGIYITTIESMAALEDVPYCDDCDTQHDPHELTVEIAFRPIALTGASHLAA